MPDLATYTAFLGAIFAYQLSGLGPDMILVISRGIGDGWRGAVAAALGCVAAGFVQVPLLALGLASLVTSTPVLYKGLQFAGAAYIIYIGVKFLLARPILPTEAAPKGSRASAAGAFRQGIVCNLTNPTTLVFMLAVLPQFVHVSAGSPATQFLVLGATMKATGLLVLGSVALASGAVGGWLARNPLFLLWQQRLAGAIMVALGLKMLLAASLPGYRR
jgi:threonine/homoserine/homoserine lactone efflux protein